MSDWINRIVLPDVYPRRQDPFRPPRGNVPLDVPAASMPGSGVGDVEVDIYEGWITDPGQRPIVYQRALNYTITAGVNALPLTNGAFQVDTIILNVYSTAANSVFFGYGSAVSVLSGLEIQPGIPVSIGADNTREQWELQRGIEAIGALLASERGYSSPGIFRAPRVVFNANEFYVIATVATNISVMLFPVPELQ